MADTHTPSLTALDLWSDVEKVRAYAPLVHSITNHVVMNLNANVLLAAGASPVMAHAHEEVQAMAGIAQSLVLNIGTLEPYWIESMRLALLTASQRGPNPEPDGVVLFGKSTDRALEATKREVYDAVITHRNQSK